MTPQNTRILKETRMLFWPWCLVMAVGVLRLAGIRSDAHHPPYMDVGNVSAFAFFIGFPFLIALSFGEEFQQRTLATLLTQPLSRLHIWREKLVVLLAAIISASLIYFLGWRSVLDRDIESWFIGLGFLLTTFGSG